jgi:hypothetical protein
MSQSAPPRVATWLLRHCVPGPLNEALAGDLLEEFRRGRSARWYWRQILAAISVACFREVASRPGMLLFAALWSMTAPAWLLFIFRFQTQTNFIGPVWRLAWPWSTICIFALSIAECLIPVWAGMLVYALAKSALSGVFSIRQLRRGLLVSLAIFIAVSIFMIGFSMLLPSLGHPFNPGALTPLGQITSLRLWAFLVRTPYLLALISALWSAASRPKNGRKMTAA